MEPPLVFLTMDPGRYTFVWMRACAGCGRALEKSHLADVVHCPCGWAWGRKEGYDA